MSETGWLSRQTTLARELRRLALARREGGEAAAGRAAEAGRVALADFLGRARENVRARRAREAKARGNDAVRRDVVDRALREYRDAVVSHAGAQATPVDSAEIEIEAEEVRGRAEEELADALWNVSALHEGAKAAARSAFQAGRVRLDEAAETVAVARSLRESNLDRYPAVRRAVARAGESRPVRKGADLDERLVEASRLLERFTRHEPSGLINALVVLAPLALALALAYPLALAIGVLPAIFVSTLSALALGVALALRARAWATFPLAADTIELDHALAEAVAALARKGRRLKRRRRQRLEEAERRRDDAERQARAVFSATIRSYRATLEHRAGRGGAKLAARVARLDRCRIDALRWAEEHLERRLRSLRKQHRRELVRSRDDYRAILDIARHDLDAALVPLDHAWDEGWASVCSAVAALDGGPPPPWDSPAWSDWTPPFAAPEAVRFGELLVPLDLGPGRAGPTAALPVLLRPAEPVNLIFRGDRPSVIDALHAVTTRLVTALPPGRLAVTVLDPVGMGRGFPGFMELAELAEGLVSYGAWAEGEQVLARLDDLASPSESEPLRLLVVADFPASFDAPAVGRLLRLMENGPRRGVFTLLGVEPGVDVAAFAPSAAVLTRDGDGFRLDDPELAGYVLAIDPPPAPEVAARLLRRVGEAANLAPAPESDWSRSAFAAPDWGGAPP